MCERTEDQWVGLVISETVNPERLTEYGRWSAGISAAAKLAPGFRARQVVEPRDPAHPEYLIVLKFDTVANLERWHQSAEFREWIAKSAPFIERRSHHQPGEGVEMWYSRPEGDAAGPPYWKQVALGVMAVFPLIIVLRTLTDPILRPLNLHPDVNLFISVVLLSCLLTRPVMPWLTRVLGGWLYPARN